VKHTNYEGPCWVMLLILLFMVLTGEVIELHDNIILRVCVHTP
jgi:hypothetical protein